ncbi:TetR/AcrR family transcriptional regulator [Sinanaerobacter sp. ZZT-01]|uniref:TetR/AcrR family transcriptional regulator n=1 Tax=Sinanaerobacter sp. ZZT-01 TaxID=3111540 RepID=UPI002D78B208|nr:TetR/AcrR family transcriptional regulator [Sinanaerobacter sp. ZZT-01]WRR93730.1 TetR/AcrR family transcriptional regulator [Sinanaerobacter sp. ZZT-01]
MARKKRVEQAAQTKNNIIRVALNLIQKKGYQNMSVRQLCLEAGISTGAFYHHFRSKEEMVNKGFALYDEALDLLLQNYEFHDPVEDIKFILLHQTKYVIEESANLTKELYIAQLSTDVKYSVKPIRKYYQVIEKLVGKAMQSDMIHTNMTVHELTSFLIRINRGVIFDWCLNDYSYDLMKRAEKDLLFVFDQLTNP